MTRSPAKPPRKRAPTSSAGGGPQRRAPRGPRAPSARPPKRPAPPRPVPRAARAQGGGLGVWLLAAAAVVALAWVGLVGVWGSAPGPGAGKEVELDWPAGLGPDEAAARLAAAGLTASPTWLALYLRATGGAGSLRAGAHLLSDDLSARSLVRRLERAHFGERARVTLPEGVHRFEIARRLHAAKVCSVRAFLAATARRDLLDELRIEGASAEGYLFPATYELALDADPDEIVRRLVGEVDKRWERVAASHAEGLESLRATLGWSRREVITLASVVEKEAVVDDERPVIAGVFLNRLRDAAFVPHRLQSDPTAMYGCVALGESIASCRGYSGKASHEINADEANPYSTYRHDGLPPGPIASPGERSIEAVLAPTPSRYLYFVARGEGRHTFSETYAQHLDAVRRK